MSQIEQLDDSFLDEQVEEVETEIVETETVEAVEDETTETVEEPVKTEPEIEDETTAPETVEKQDSWTFSQAMDEREKRQAAVKRADELQKELDALKKPADDVSVFEDEKGYTEQQDKKVATAVNAASLGMSRAYAVREFGEEKVAQAEKWYADEGMKSPHAIDRLHKSDLKFHEAVSLMEEEQARLDTEGLEAKVEARIRAEYEEKYGKEPSEEPRKPITPSLASKRSAGNEQYVPEDFEDMLGE